MQGDQEEALGGGRGAPIIVKKITVTTAHHGGAWKVAFADFVTAMMALFMVMWLMNANEERREAIAGYFSDPRGFGEKLGSGMVGSGGGLSIGEQELHGLADRIQSAIRSMPNFAAAGAEQVTTAVTGEGLRIELLESAKGTFFESGSPSPSRVGRDTLAIISGELAKLPNTVIIEGHTDALPFRGRRDYSNWELSVDRANSARRLLLGSGVESQRIVQVRGFADVQLRKPESPDHPSNRRISLIVEYEDQALEFAPEESAAMGPPAESAAIGGPGGSAGASH
jgi:chemotaxis protein MotB